MAYYSEAHGRASMGWKKGGKAALALRSLGHFPGHQTSLEEGGVQRALGLNKVHPEAPTLSPRPLLFCLPATAHHYTQLPPLTYICCLPLKPIFPLYHDFHANHKFTSSEDVAQWVRMLANIRTLVHIPITHAERERERHRQSETER